MEKTLIVSILLKARTKKMLGIFCIRPLTRLVLIVYILTYNITVKSQSELTVMGAVNLFQTADSLRNEKLYSQSNIFAQFAKNIHLENNDWEAFYVTVNLIRKNYSSLDEDLIFADSLKLYFDLVPNTKLFIRAKILFQRAFIFLKHGHSLSSFIIFKQSLNGLLTIPDDICSRDCQVYLTFTYYNLAIAASRLGDHVSALEFAEAGIIHTATVDGKPKMCDFLNVKGHFLFYNSQLDKAKNLCTTRLKECAEELDQQLLLAKIFLTQDSLILAKEVMQNIEEGFESSLLAEMDSGYFGDYYIIKSEIAFKENEIELGIKFREMAIDALNNDLQFRVAIKEKVSLSEHLFNNNRKFEAVSLAHAALRDFYPYLDSLDILDRPYYENNLPDIWIFEALKIKAKYFINEYINNKVKQDLEEAYFYFELLFSYFDKLKNKYYSNSSKYRMGEYTQSIYSEVIDFFASEFVSTGKQEYFDKAFTLAQRANAFVLKNAVSDRKALELANVPKDSLEKYLELSALVSSDNDEEKATNQVETFSEYDAYRKSLYTNYPAYAKYVADNNMTVPEIQYLLQENSLLLKYYYFEGNLKVFGVTKNSSFLENIELPAEFNSLVVSNSDIISQNNIETNQIKNYLKNSKKVYDLILGDLLVKHNFLNKDHLMIIPDGPLKKIAFNALVTKEARNWNNPDIYLMSDYSISYLYYCSQLKANERNSTQNRGFLSFGIQYKDEFLREIVDKYMLDIKEVGGDSRAISLNPLEFADDEAILSANILNGRSMVNEEVTKKSVLANIHNNEVLHFAAHAFVNEADYMNSFIVLNKDEENEYQLSYRDILNLNIDSDLVVLSACQTGSGKNVNGEGLMSLSRAFAQSGSKASLGAYWNAPDYATKELMVLFYSNLSAGMTKSKALQQAQIEYLTNDNISTPMIRSPFFWASWAIYGNDEPLPMATSFWSPKAMLFVGLTGLLLLFLGFKYFRK